MKFIFTAVVSSVLLLVVKSDPRISLLPVQNVLDYKTYQTGEIYAIVGKDEPNLEFSSFKLHMENNNTIYYLGEALKPPQGAVEGDIFPVYRFENFTEDMELANGVNVVTLSYQQREKTSKKIESQESKSSLMVGYHPKYNALQDSFCPNVFVVPKAQKEQTQKPQNVLEEKNAKTDANEEKEEASKKQEHSSNGEDEESCCDKDEDCEECLRDNGVFEHVSVAKVTLVIAAIACSFFAF